MSDKKDYSDLGLNLVAEFQKAFGAYIAPREEVPDFGGRSLTMLRVYGSVAKEWGENLKDMAQAARDHGDEAGCLLLIRLQLIQEELAELAEAMIERDIVECFDALLDLSYVVDGAYLTLGLADRKVAGLKEVHRSNMSKMGPDGKPVMSSAGRVVKGPDFSPPDLKAVLRKTGDHILYETGDKDAPDVIKDRNGEVVLGLCRLCGKAEIELSEPCVGVAAREEGRQRPPALQQSEDSGDE